MPTPSGPDSRGCITRATRLTGTPYSSSCAPLTAEGRFPGRHCRGPAPMQAPTSSASTATSTPTVRAPTAPCAAGTRKPDAGSTVLIPTAPGSASAKGCSPSFPDACSARVRRASPHPGAGATGAFGTPCDTSSSTTSTTPANPVTGPTRATRRAPACSTPAPGSPGTAPSTLAAPWVSTLPVVGGGPLRLRTASRGPHVQPPGPDRPDHGSLRE
jgi:hypothetical protein